MENDENNFIFKVKVYVIYIRAIFFFGKLEVLFFLGGLILKKKKFTLYKHNILLFIFIFMQ